MTTKFKVGDEVICVENNYGSPGSGWDKDKKFIINSVEEHSDRNVYFPVSGNGIYETHLELSKSYKSKKPTHLVMWEEDRDPCELFDSEEKAKTFIKELSEKSSVKKDSIILVEIKSCRKITITKSLRYTEHKI